MSTSGNKVLEVTVKVVLDGEDLSKRYEMGRPYLMGPANGYLMGPANRYLMGTAHPGSTATDEDTLIADGGQSQESHHDEDGQGQ
jgi:hypothetical protein